MVRAQKRARQYDDERGIRMSADIGIDLGTASVLVYVKGKGVILKEPSVVAYDRDSNAIKAIGEEARLMLGRTPGNIIAVRPLRQGVISDYTVTEKMIKYFVQKALGKRTFKKPRISICVPSGVTEVERKAVEEAAYAAGAREVNLIEEPVAAAIGAGIDISKPCGNMIVDIGGGTSDIAVISLGGTVVNTSLKLADRYLIRDRGSLKRAYRTDRGGGHQCSGTHAAGIVRGYPGPGDHAHRRRLHASGTGRTDRRTDRH